MKRPRGGSIAIEPRSAVTAMRPYKPPLEGRCGRLRLDFNENPMGCSRSVRRALAMHIAEDDMATAPLIGAYEWPRFPTTMSIAVSARNCK